MPSLQTLLGSTDIYLLDQIMRGRIQPGMKILDAGCGGGRNIMYLIHEGYDVYAVDEDPEAIRQVQRMAPNLSTENFRLESIESMSFEDGAFDFVIVNTVLHFAHDDFHFEAMLSNCIAKLKIGGILFCRLASSIGIEGQIQHVTGRRYLLMDGTERFLVDAQMIEHITSHYGELLDPIKTTVVHNQRAMTTWVILRTK